MRVVVHESARLGTGDSNEKVANLTATRQSQTEAEVKTKITKKDEERRGSVEREAGKFWS